MKTFKQFLETSKFDLEKFKSECAFALEQLQRGHLLLYHGTKNFPDDFAVRSWRPRAGPRDSRHSVHDALNALFQKKFGAPIRNWMFATGSRTTAAHYAGTSQPCVIFPKGTFEWVCSPDQNMSDLTTLFDTEYRKIPPSVPDDQREQLAIEKIAELVDRAQWWHNEQLGDCVRSKNEIMIKCSDFYIFNTDGRAFIDELEDFLRTR